MKGDAYKVVQPRIVETPWGREHWVDINSDYVIKELFVNSGQRLSLQYHKEKEETMYFVSGYGKIQIKDIWYKYKPHDVWHIHPLCKHRIHAETDTLIFEVSTPQTEDIVRLEDDYGRD